MLRTMRIGYKYSTIAKVFLVCCIFGYEIFTLFGTFIGFSDESSTFSYIIRGFVLAGALYVLPRLVFFRGDKRVMRFLIFFFIFWIWYVSRVTIDAILNPAVLRITYIEYIALSLGQIVFPAIACFLLAYKGHLEKVEFTLFWMLLFGGCVISVGFFTQPLEIDLNQRGIYLGKLNSTAISNLGRALSLTSIYVLLKNQSLGLGYKSFIFFAGLGLGLPLVVTGASRAAALGLIIGIIFVFLAARKSLHYGHIVMLSLISSALIFMAINILSNGLTGALVERIDSGIFTDSNRAELLKDAAEGYFSSPILGLGTEPLGWYPHNIIVEAFLANGLFFGLLICYLSFLVFMYSLFIIFKKPDFAILPILFIVSFLSSMVSGNIYADNVFWVLMASVTGLYFCVGFNSESRRKSFANK
jgi:hypothetical protein